ncbi:MAG TPA: glycosyltransferase [Thermoplasmata archaeon]|nr:glycosyltransferase [Thermoplasmata archaeon]
MKSPPSRLIVVSTYPPDHSGVGKSAFDLLQYVRLKREVKVVANLVPNWSPPHEGVVAVWTRGSPSFPFRAALAVGRLQRGPPSIVTVNHHFLLYGGLPSNLGFLVLLFLLRLRGAKVGVEIHSVIDTAELRATDSAQFRRLRGPLVRLGLRLFYRTIADLSELIRVPGLTSGRILSQEYGLDPARIRVVSPGWDQYGAPATRAQTEHDQEEAAPTVLFHGFLDPTKGLEVLLDAFASLPPGFERVRLVLAGEVSPEIGSSGREYEHSLRDRIRELGLEHRVVLTGYLPEEALVKVLAEATVIALPYTMTVSRGGSAVLSRVGSLGRALIASRISRFSDELHDGVDAVLVAPGDVSELAQAIVRLLSDDSTRVALGRQLREESTHRGWDTMATEMERSVYSVLEAEGRTRG